MSFLNDLGRRPTLTAGLAILLVVLVRLVVVILSPAEIGPDEAQYWRWSHELSFGYYSKPPLIAWAIAASTTLFGDGEWAIRFFAPILHGGAAFMLFLLGRDAFSIRTGAWASAVYLLMPGVFLSSAIMSTDALLLPAAAAALYFLWRFRAGGGFADAAFAGLALGLAMLAKYAALYIYGGIALAALLDRDMRRSVLSPAGGVLLGCSLLVLTPNLLWNAANDFATIGHTADNANFESVDVDVLRVGSFLADQAAVFGPVMLIALLTGLALIAGRHGSDIARREVWLICFVAPPLIVILGQEILSRAHANWAAIAYPGACVLLASWIDRMFGRPASGRAGGWRSVALWIKAGVAVNVAIGLLFSLAWVVPGFAETSGLSSAMKGVRGWKETVAELSTRAGDIRATAIMVDDRELWHGLDYYGRDKSLPPVRAWRRGAIAHSHAEQEGQIRTGEDVRVLVASGSEWLRVMIRQDFRMIQDIGYLSVPIGPQRERRLKLYLASGYAPAERTQAFESRFASQREP